MADEQLKTTDKDALLARPAADATAAEELEAEVPASNPVIITIERDFGAEGHEIGKMLSQELDLPFYDNEILVRASARAGAPVEEVAAYDARLAAELSAFLPDRIDARSAADKLFGRVSSVIRDLGSVGPCILVGRLSDYILRENPNRIAVLVTAPEDYRVEVVRQKRGMTRKEARKLVRRMQKGREMNCHRYSAGKCEMHDGKDLVLNRERFSREECVAIIAAAYRAKAAQVGSAGAKG